jgi:hypothetical protein
VLPISDIPVCLREFASQFRKLFKHPAQRQHFEEVLAGLIVSENRTVAGIQQKLLSNTEYDSLQHFMTDSPWSHDEMRKARLAVVSKLVSKEPAELNVIAIDSTLIHHTGADIHGVYWYWDYVNHRFCLGQKLVVSSFVTAKTVVPLGMELYHRGFLPEQKLYLEATKPAANASEEAWDEYNLLVKEYEKNCSEHKTQLVLAGDLVDECERNNIPVDVYVFDGGFLDIALMDRVDAYRQPWVCRLAKNRSVQLPSGKFDTAQAFAHSLKKEDFKPVEIKTRLGVKKTYWVFAKNVKVKFWKKLRMVISYDNPELEGEPKYFLSNKLNWVQAQKILQPYMYRDPIEHLFRDEKQELGLEKCQQRKKQAVLKFWELSFLAHTFLELGLKVDYPEGMPAPRCESLGQRARFMEMKMLQSFIARIKALVLDKQDTEELLTLITRKRLNRLAC